jgi:formamidopyrimidine-DNA glycosylase
MDFGSETLFGCGKNDLREKLRIFRQRLAIQWNMPELPEVEAVTTKLREMAVGAEIADAVEVRPGMTRPQAFADFRRQIKGQKIVAAERRAKNILLSLSNDHFVRGHLGMTGNLYVVADHRLRPHTCRIYLKLKDGKGIILDDPRTFGRLTAHSNQERADLFAGYGPEPLSADFSTIYLAQLAKNCKMPAKVALLDQSKVAGLGNIWVAEALFQARVHPSKPLNQLNKAKLVALHQSIVATLTRAVESALAIYSQPSIFPEAEEIGLDVYGREGEPCVRCKKLVGRFVQAGRSTYFCPGCQKL